MSKVGKFIKDNVIIVILLLFIIFMSIFGNNFATAKNFITILRQVSILGVASCGLMFVLITGHIDLSIGSVMSFSSVVFAMLISNDYLNLNPVLAIVILMAICVLWGLFKGVLVVYCHMPAMIATLGVSTLMSGITYLLCNAKVISHLNESVIFLGQGYLSVIPWPVIIFALIVVISGFIQKKTYIGRHIYATGSNSEAAHLAGINVASVKMSAYVVCTMLSGFAGIILACRVKGGQATAGDQYQMNSLTACAVGGISLAGGEGTIFNVICGVLLMGVITNGMTILGLNVYWQDVMQGAVLIVAVAIDYLQRTGVFARLKKKSASA